jgi:hypothetical protein
MPVAKAGKLVTDMPDHSRIQDEITRLEHLTVGELRHEWIQLIGTEYPRQAQRAYLLRAIAHHLQVKRHGGLPASLRRKLLKLAERPLSPTAPTRTLKAGARLLREWRGALHEVEVLDSGYRYKERNFKSLSGIAREITGTQWSGPVFFGLKRDAA